MTHIWQLQEWEAKIGEKMKEQLESNRLNKQSQEAASSKKLQEKVDSL